MTDNKATRYAQKFTALGYSVYPVHLDLDSNGSKIVEIKWTPESPGWSTGQYPTDPAEIAQHWKGFDGILVNTGRSGLVVVDIDVKGEVDGWRGLEEAGIVLPSSPLTVRTWSGGEHRYFRQGGMPVDNSQSVLARGVDIRGLGGIAFAPPSPVGTKAYEVELVPYLRDLPVFPEHLAQKLAAAKPVQRVFEGGSERDLLPHEVTYHEGRRDSALEAISEAGDGERRAALARFGCIVIGTAPLLKADVESHVGLIREAYEMSGGYEWDKHERLISDLVKYVSENPFVLPTNPVAEPLPEGVAEVDREEFVKVKTRKQLSRIADREIRQEELEWEAARLSLGAPENLAELVADPPESPLWLVDRLLHADRLRGLVIGQAKAGKSRLVHNLLAGLSTGGKFLGEFPVSRPVKVAYVDLELGRRLAYEWLTETPGVNPSNVEYYDRVGQGFKLDTRADGLRRRWAQELADLRVDILIIDPLSPVLSALGVSEDSSEVRGLLDSFDALAEMAGMLGVVVCHHAGHSNAERGRGSSAFNDWFTTKISVALQSENAHDQPRRLTIMGRGVPYLTGTVRKDAFTGALDMERDLPPLGDSDPFVNFRDQTLTLKEAAELLGQAEITARRKLEKFGWVSDGSSGGRVAAEWRYALGQGVDPFGDM